MSPEPGSAKRTLREVLKDGARTLTLAALRKSAAKAASVAAQKARGPLGQAVTALGVAGGLTAVAAVGAIIASPALRHGITSGGTDTVRVERDLAAATAALATLRTGSETIQGEATDLAAAVAAVTEAQAGLRDAQNRAVSALTEADREAALADRDRFAALVQDRRAEVATLNTALSASTSRLSEQVGVLQATDADADTALTRLGEVLATTSTSLDDAQAALDDAVAGFTAKDADQDAAAATQAALVADVRDSVTGLSGALDEMRAALDAEVATRTTGDQEVRDLAGLLAARLPVFRSISAFMAPPQTFTIAAGTNPHVVAVAAVLGGTPPPQAVPCRLSVTISGSPGVTFALIAPSVAGGGTSMSRAMNLAPGDHTVTWSAGPAPATCSFADLTITAQRVG